MTIIYFSFQKSSTEYEGISDVENRHHADLPSRLSPTASTSAMIDDHSDIVAAAAAFTRKPHTVPDGVGGGTLSFKLSLPAHMTEQHQRIADVGANF